MTKEQLCPIAESIKIIGTTPRLLIVRYLNEGVIKNNDGLGFNEMKRLSKLSSRTLALNLKYLLEKGIVDVKDFKNRRFYSLTKRGKEVIPIISSIGEWGSRWNIYKN